MQEGSSHIDVNTVIKVVGGIMVIGGISKILKKLGLEDDPYTQDAGVNFPFWNKDSWHSLNWPQAKQNEVYTRAYPAAVQLENALGLVTDDYSTVINAIKSLHTQAEISFLCDVFYYEYAQDLYEYLKNGYGGGIFPWDGLSVAHLTQINDYIQKMPKQ